MREAGTRVDAVATLASPVRATLETPEQRVVLRGALVVADGTLRGAGSAGDAEGVRLRLTKAGQNVLDLTANAEGAFLLASRDFEERASGGQRLNNPTARGRARLPRLAEALELAVGWPALGPTLETTAGLRVAETLTGDATFEHDLATGEVRVYPSPHPADTTPEAAAQAAAVERALLTLRYRPASIEGLEVLVLRSVGLEAGDVRLTLRLTEPMVNEPVVPGAFDPPAQAEPL